MTLFYQAFGILALVSMVGPCLADDEQALTLIGRDGQTTRLTKAEFRALPHVDASVTDRGGETARFSGVEISELLSHVGVPTGVDQRGEWMRCYVVMSASDGYRAVYGLPEFNATFRDRKILLADQRNDTALDAQHGPFQLVVPDENRHSRWIRMVREIRVVDAGHASP